MQFDQFKVTQALYTQLHGFVQTKAILDASPTPGQQKVIENLGEAFMNTYEGVRLLSCVLYLALEADPCSGYEEDHR